MAKKLAFDHILFTTLLVLVGFGLTMVYSASAVVAGAGTGGRNPLIVKQVVAALLGLAVMWVVMHADYRWLWRKPLAWSLVGLAVTLLAVALLSPELNNTKRWLFIAGVSFQPSEFAKLVLVIFLARQMAKYEKAGRSVRYLMPAIAVAALFSLLVLLGRDLGSTLMLLSITGILLFLAGMPVLWMASGALLIAPAVVSAVMLVPYRRQRFLAFLNPEQDPLGSGFQALQSLIALGSGAGWGSGSERACKNCTFCRTRTRISSFRSSVRSSG